MKRSIASSPARVITILLAVLALVLGSVHAAPMAHADEHNKYGTDSFPGTPVDEFPGAVKDLDFAKKLISNNFGVVGSQKIGFGFCIDLGFKAPKDPALSAGTAGEVTDVDFLESGYQKLTHIGSQGPGRDGKTNIVPLEGEFRDSLIHLVRQYTDMARNGGEGVDRQEAAKMHLAIWAISSTSARTRNNLYQNIFLGDGDPNLRMSPEEFTRLTGMEIVGDNPAHLYLRPVKNFRDIIPEAKKSDYITVIVPKGYDIDKFVNLTGKELGGAPQRFIPIDQPGLSPESPARPTSEVPSPEEVTPVTSERPAPVKSEIGTSAAFAEGADRVKAGATVNDTVTYKNLVPGKVYTLEAQLVDKADASKVLGSGLKEFTPEKADGEVVVPIKVNDAVTEPVAAAVAFETLKSDDAKAQESRAESLTDGSVPSGDVIADHKDINDAAQTVESEKDEPQSADIQLKKYIGGKSEVASVEAAEGLKDSQTEAEAYKASA
ncbi:MULTISPECIES: VaFE repeat-containing surface-anchored protein, partial [unclassified Corynebacterium]|uniref:VaFE repeat-containing surface-anchored protein n=1 Tax=unclassified Corynebacterium TaxID=2624378 RepID=UPI001D0E5B41